MGLTVTALLLVIIVCLYEICAGTGLTSYITSNQLSQAPLFKPVSVYPAITSLPDTPTFGIVDYVLNTYHLKHFSVLII
jgi:hypothetical protein